MNVTNISKQALAQIYYIWDSFSETTKNKVPNNLITTIRENMDMNYTNTSELLEETKEILYAILNKYILNQTQKEKLAEYYRFYDAKMEAEKVKKYQYENLFDNNKKEIKNVEKNTNNISLVLYKENIFIKLINKIKSIFKGN